MAIAGYVIESTEKNNVFPVAGGLHVQVVMEMLQFPPPFPVPRRLVSENFFHDHLQHNQCQAYRSTYFGERFHILSLNQFMQSVFLCTDNGNINYSPHQVTFQPRPFQGMTIKNRCPVSQQAWHAKEPSLLNVHSRQAKVNICNPSPVMVTSPCENHKETNKTNSDQCLYETIMTCTCRWSPG